MKLRGSIASPYVARVVMCARAKGIALDPGIAFPTAALPRLRDWWQQMGEDPLCVQVLEEEQVPA